ncbi:S-layer family protein [Nostoc sp. LEGE 12447]|uniref:two-partner secretion domain-containing protein n=1 Tax=Nostoc sp. LEGE 12447 TaxID=1828640 RepID=UPI00188423B8|nr:S-layer family protein [Nostoc sp. LEGE 12447]MBE9001539.1 S-layer family protein [Nostoc sp. LEGE 12447]
MSGITQYWRCWCSSFVACGMLIASSQESVFAQIIPDNTLPNNSSVTREGNIFNITGGTQAGSNLFHSFSEFSVPLGSTAFFNNAVYIQNIISRVTGGSASNIDGLIRAHGTANLFLINPNGIIFGQGARLDIGGSFVGTTANAIGFGDRGFFSASNPEGSPSLLTVNPSALLFNQIQTASIQNNSVGLRVPDGNSLLLVGGDINMNGGGLFAFGGRVELGGLAGAGTVGLNGDGNNLSLRFPDSVEKSDVFLSNGARVAVIAGDGGSITINARNFEMTGSLLIAGIGRGLGSDNSRAGNIDINATGATNFNTGSLIVNQVQPGANGQAGDVSISASTLKVSEAEVNTNTLGAGKGGNLTIDAQDVQLIGRGRLFASANLNSTGDAGKLTVKTNTLLVQDGAKIATDTSGVGKGGNLTIKTNTLLVKNGAQVGAGTFGAGKGGNLTVDAQNVQLIGTSVDGVLSGLFASAQRNSTGDSGNLTIKTNTLLVKNGAQVDASTLGAGKGGNLTIDSQDVQLIDRGSGLFTSANLNLTGDAGDLTIKTNTLLVKDGAQVGTVTFGAGKGGNLTIDAQDVQLIGGTSDDGRFTSGLSASAQRNSTGDAGDLTIKTNTLLVKDGAQVGAGTFGAGKGGNLTVDAQNVQLIGTSANGPFASGLAASAQPDSTGDAGDLTIKTNTLLVQGGAQVNTATFGEGNGGSLTVDAQDVQLINRNSGLAASAQPDSTGDAGDLTIKTNTLLVQDGARVTVESLGTGTAGNLTVDTRSIRLNNNALLSANIQSSKVNPNSEQATININSENLIMSRNSNIRTNAIGENVTGGNINIDTDFLIGFENSDISANSANFRGGNVRINAQGIFGIQFRDVASDSTSDITATGASSDFSGSVELNTPEIDPNSGLVELPTISVDTEVAQGCYSPSYAQSKFAIAGRGGLPANPKDILTPDAVKIDWVSLKPSNNNRSLPPVAIKPTISTPKRIVEATGAVLNAKGQIVLTANSSTASPHTSRQNPIQCHGS